MNDGWYLNVKQIVPNGNKINSVMTELIKFIPWNNLHFTSDCNLATDHQIYKPPELQSSYAWSNFFSFSFQIYFALFFCVNCVYSNHVCDSTLIDETAKNSCDDLIAKRSITELTSLGYVVEDHRGKHLSICIKRFQCKRRTYTKKKSSSTRMSLTLS